MINRTLVVSILLAIVSTKVTATQEEHGDAAVGGSGARLRRRELNEGGGVLPANSWSSAGRVEGDASTLTAQDTSGTYTYTPKGVELGRGSVSEFLSGGEYEAARGGWGSKGSKSKGSKSSKSSKGDDDDDDDCYYGYGKGGKGSKGDCESSPDETTKHPPAEEPSKHPQDEPSKHPQDEPSKQPQEEPSKHPPSSTTPHPNPAPTSRPPPQCGMPGLGTCDSGQCKCKCVPNLFPTSTTTTTRPPPESTKESKHKEDDAASLSDASCSAHAACAHLGGNCCPNNVGDMLDCCSNA